MQYREIRKTGDKLSVLGYGCLRFPQKNGKIDEERAERQFVDAIARGVNYFDTAYIYNGGKSESILGRVLSKGLRDKVNIATKIPPYLVNSKKDLEAILEKQLTKLCTDHIDYYLIHALSDLAGWNRLKSLGIEEFFESAKAKGKIKYIGFSYHGDRDEFKKLIDAYDWDICQIQFNYIDVDYQAGLEGLKYAASKGIGVIIMEPLRGGSLVGKMPVEIKDIWDGTGIKRSPAEWALRFIWNYPGVTCVLSGMNEECQIEENTKIAEEAFPNILSKDELLLYKRVKEEYVKLMKVGCTGCGYCMPCPAGVDIPLCFSYYNTKHLFKKSFAKYQYIGFTSGMAGGNPRYASLCIGCGKCEKVCPQHIPIRMRLKEVSKDMEIPIIKPLMWLLRKYLNRRNKKNI